jgi:hypothetical protein
VVPHGGQWRAERLTMTRRWLRNPASKSLRARKRDGQWTTVHVWQLVAMAPTADLARLRAARLLGMPEPSPDGPTEPSRGSYVVPSRPPVVTDPGDDCLVALLPPGPDEIPTSAPLPRGTRVHTCGDPACRTCVPHGDPTNVTRFRTWRRRNDAARGDGETSGLIPADVADIFAHNRVKVLPRRPERINDGGAKVSRRPKGTAPMMPPRGFDTLY